MIKAVIFDMDGLLIDSEPLWEEAEVEVFNTINVPLTRKMTRETMGLRVDEVVDYWYAKYPWQKVSKKEIKTKIVKRVIQLIEKKGQIHEGVLEAIKLLKDRHIPLAIASSSLTEIINTVLEKIGIRDAISVICSAEAEVYGKPHPGVYLTTAKKLGVDPKDILVFEDSPNGVISAKAAGMKCIAIPSQKVKGDPKFKLADQIIDSLKELNLSILGL